MADEMTSVTADDADETARVAALVARAGLRLPSDQIAELVAAYRSDRAGFERLRTILQDADEPAHAFRARPSAERPA